MGPSANWPAPAPPPQVPRRLAGRFEPPFGPAGKPLSELGALPDAPRARLRLALLGCLPPARPAISPAAPTGAPPPLDLPGGLARPLSQGRDAPPAAPLAPGLED
ncbi:hypothetical protein N7447_011365 [Penicillium robsamsonii]|uniref:uncharacterized protein n=1 Tax=Penicillium robsamsonii TaxID=1792511 RepID=UPI002547383A|nr:uncharacterized protein N7447_011360 [Penicillium robsamsonii]XP_057080270.1 uncharacterized protein N7447_011365 [Penicillium robsamsonii]KAJ5807127.1 hypothetical protein N7447_011360 [Penicillium robsamsonii]KAJ5807132.1 hypothetical protein N7447_011365 [Penicillium robsamsonii]